MIKHQTLPIDIQIFKQPSLINMKPLSKTLSEPGIDLEFMNDSKNLSKVINQNEHNLHASKHKMSDFLLEKLTFVKNILKFKYVFKEILVRNIFAILFLILLIEVQIYVDQYFTCDLDNSNFLKVLYFELREIYFFFYFYFLYGSYAFFSLFQIKPKIIQLMSLNSFFFLNLKVYHVDPFEDYLDLNSANILLGLLTVFIYYKKNKIPWKKLQKGLISIFLLVFFLFMVNHYVMKSYVITEIKEMTLQFEDKTLGGIIFQIFLFIYFRIYHMIFFKSLVIYSKLSKNADECKDSIIMFSKCYILDAVCSSVPLAVCEHLNTKQAWLGMFNFTYQILVLYDPDFDILKHLRKLIYKILKKKEDDLNNHEKKVIELLSLSLNEVIIIIYFQILLLFGFRRCLNLWLLVIKCDFSIPDYIEIMWENVVILMVLNSFLVVGLAIRKNNPLKLMWSLESYSSLFQIYYIVILHFAVDFNLQFYIYCFYLKTSL